jgi:hypothetical protein
MQLIFQVNKISACASRKYARWCCRATQGAPSSVRRMVVNQLDLRRFSDVLTFCAARGKPRRAGKTSLRYAFFEIDAVLDAHVLSDRLPFSKSRFA